MIAAVLLIVAARQGRGALVVYGVTTVLVFGVSATYHRLAWNTRHQAWWRRADRSTIFLFIAGTFTPLALLTHNSRLSWTLLAVMLWAVGSVGIAII